MDAVVVAYRHERTGASVHDEGPEQHEQRERQLKRGVASEHERGEGDAKLAEDDEEDPRAQLIRRLQEYERFKKAAEDIEELPRVERDTWIGSANPPQINRERPDPDVDMRELLLALGEVLRRADMFESHHIQREALSTRERMSQVLEALSGKQFVPFVALFTADEGRLGVVVTFLAVMELMKESLVEIVQTDEFGPIHIKARSE